MFSLPYSALKYYILVKLGIAGILTLLGFMATNNILKNSKIHLMPL